MPMLSLKSFLPKSRFVFQSEFHCSIHDRHLILFPLYVYHRYHRRHSCSIKAPLHSNMQIIFSVSSYNPHCAVNLQRKNRCIRNIHIFIICHNPPAVNSQNRRKKNVLMCRYTKNEWLGAWNLAAMQIWFAFSGAPWYNNYVYPILSERSLMQWRIR